MSVRTGVVVVGLDDSGSAAEALEFALDEGLAHGCAVEVVTAWLLPSPYEGMEHVTTMAEGQRTAEEAQTEALRRVLDARAENPVVSQTVVHGSAGRALVERAEGARMLVVGSARKGTLARAVLGSVSEHCVRHAPAPVVVVARPERITHHNAGEIELSEIEPSEIEPSEIEPSDEEIET
jgi:nucleotide-binding universal stress UspA family protein